MSIMDLEVKGKRAIVTGGTAGIGLAIAKRLAAEGAHVFVPGRSKEKTDAAVKSIEGKATAIIADLSSASGAKTLIQQVPEADILINNLGIYEPKPFTEITDEDWFRIFETNVMSGIRLSRHYFPLLLQQGWGRIIFIASESALLIPAEMIHYGMTKTAQLAIARGLAELSKGTRVTVNSVLPGPTRSEGIAEFLQKMSSAEKPSAAESEKEFFEKHRSASLLQRLIEAEEIANLVAFLASPLSSATNGAALRAEGGLIRSIA